MANTKFSPALEGFLRGEVQWITPTIKVALVRGYTFSAAHKWVSDITGAGGTIHGTPVAIANKTAADGVADTTDATLTFTAPAADANDHYVLIYQSSAVGGGADVAATAQRVIAWIDTANGLPIRPNGANVVLTWDTGANGIFRL